MNKKLSLIAFTFMLVTAHFFIIYLYEQIPKKRKGDHYHGKTQKNNHKENHNLKLTGPMVEAIDSKRIKASSASSAWSRHYE
jgi:hypothetical protein